MGGPHLQVAGLAPQERSVTRTAYRGIDVEGVERATRELLRALGAEPEATLRAFADHGDAGRASDWRAGAAAETLRQVDDAGVDLAAVTAELEHEGVRSFCNSYREPLDCIESKLRPSVLTP
jgi:transaldolase